MIRVLTKTDISAAMCLKEAAGWNQTEQDLTNLLTLSPDGCFGIEHDGMLVSTTTAACYGRRLAWIGMVLTHPSYRGRGFARELMEHTVEFLCARGIEWIKLDATPMGLPLYKKLGFVDECAVERWWGKSMSCPANHLQRATQRHAPLDQQAFGADRSELLQLLAGIESAEIEATGYAMGRPGTHAAYFGPCVTRSAEDARNLLSWFLYKHAGEPVYWDLLPTNHAAIALARQFGFERRRELVRMVRQGAPDAKPLEQDGDKVFAIAGFEFG